MSAPSFKTGDRATVTYHDNPIAVLTVTKAAARVTLSDGSEWHVSKYAKVWIAYGRKGDGYGKAIRPTQPGDVEAVRARNAKIEAEAERRYLVGCIVGLSWSTVDALSTESLRQIVAFLDAAKDPPT